MMDIKDLRIVYMGTPDMSARLLEHLVKMGLNIVGVVAQTDQKIGRKQQIQEVPTKIVAKSLISLFINRLKSNMTIHLCHN